MGYNRGSLRKHEALKQRILTHPELVGINRKDVLSIETEYPLKRKKRPIAQPDIVIFYRKKNKVRKRYIEIKSGSCRRALEDLEQQLRKISKYLKYKRMDGEVMGVYPRENSIALLVL